MLLSEWLIELLVHLKDWCEIPKARAAQSATAQPAISGTGHLPFATAFSLVFLFLSIGRVCE